MDVKPKINFATPVNSKTACFWSNFRIKLRGNQNFNQRQIFNKSILNW